MCYFVSVEAVNGTAGPIGLAFSELVFGVRPTFFIASESN